MHTSRIHTSTLAGLLALLLSAQAVAETKWQIETAEKFDALCLTGALADDPFYTRFYEKELEELRSTLSTETFEAAARAHRAFKDEGVLSGPWLALAYSVVPGASLSAAIEATSEPGNIRRGLEASDYWDEREWSVYERTRGDVLAMLRGLQEGGFTQWWKSAAREPSRSRAAELEPVLADIDVVPMVEKAVGRRLRSGGITLYAARFCRPHGIRVTGDRFLLDIVDSRNPLPIAVATAIHEMVHPPFDVEDDRILRLIDALKEDSFIYGRWESHDPSFGYNTFPGYVDENVTKALDQLIGERVGMTFMEDVEERWIQNDDGMHVLAAAVYELMKSEGFLDGSENATEFLDRMVREEKLVAGRIEPLVPERVRRAKAATE
jgi:hypothetical protein